jgi:hypothetical protein
MPRPPRLIHYARRAAEAVLATIVIVVACALIGAASLLQVG